MHEDYLGAHNRDKLNDLRSVSKTIIATLVGLAVDNYYIASVDDKVMPLFPEYDSSQNWNENWHDRKNDISIRHLLTSA